MPWEAALEKTKKKKKKKKKKRKEKKIKSNLYIHNMSFSPFTKGNSETLLKNLTDQVRFT